MGRNKYPEETVNKILSVSMQLFTEKGYENTSIQDIIDQLGGLTKGAIYHHFKSKEDIMLALISAQSEVLDAQWQDIIHSKSGMTGLEKLSKMFYVSTQDSRQERVFKSAPDMLNNAKMLTLQLESIMAESAPYYIQPIIEEGIADGSIDTKYPKELAEVILLLINIWVTPMVFKGSEQDIIQRVEFFRDMAKALGADFIDDRLYERFTVLTHLYFEQR